MIQLPWSDESLLLSSASAKPDLYLRRLCSYGCTSRIIFISIFYAWKMTHLLLVPKIFICIYYACTIEKWLIYVVSERDSCLKTNHLHLRLCSCWTTIYLHLRLYSCCWTTIHLQYLLLCSYASTLHSSALLRLCYYWKMTHPHLCRRSKKILHLHLPLCL